LAAAELCGRPAFSCEGTEKLQAGYGNCLCRISEIGKENGGFKGKAALKNL
jgi:hypothetical protein